MKWTSEPPKEPGIKFEPRQETLKVEEWVDENS